MSKKHGASKKRKKAARKRSRSRSTLALLSSVADALNACDRRGLKIRFAFGAAYCEQGVVVPPLDKGQKWEARPFRGRPRGIPDRDWDDD